MTKTFNLKDIPEHLLPEVGGKARGLYRLLKMGFDVPEAFIVYGANQADDLAEAVVKYRELGFDTVSVRSSATLEDGADFSAAGQFSTFLGVKGEKELVEAIKACLNSLNNETAINYANSFLGGQKGSMTVVVQRMLDPRCAGVIFTQAPMRPGFSLVEAVPGLGENLVSGKMSAQQYRVRDEIIEQVPEYPYLSNGEAVRLAKAGLAAQKEFGLPLDLEWAIDKAGRIWWLQARPITVTESVTMNELDCRVDARNFVLTTGNIGEMMPGAVTPLGISTNMYALDWGVKETYARFGACSRDIPDYSFIAPYYNHMFFNMTNMYRASHSVIGSTKESMDISICGKVLEGFPDSDMPDQPMYRKLINSVPFLKLVFSGEAAKQGMAKVVDGLKFNLDDSIEGLSRQIDDNFDALKWAQFYHYCASYYSGGQSNFLLMAVQDKFKDRTNELQALISGCLTQIEEFESASILRCMISLAQRMLDDNAEVRDYDVEQLQKYIKTAPEAVRESYDAFMERHGHRGIREPEIMSLPWRDNPASFFTSLRSVLSSMGGTARREEKPWTEYADELVGYFAKASKKRNIRSLIDRARKGVCYREYTKARTILVLDEFRTAYRALASKMVDAGMLPDAECIFFLLREEVGVLVAGDRSVVKKALARRRLFPAQQKLKFPYCQMGIPVPLSTKVDDSKAIKLQGTPVSRGIAGGIARIVRTEEDASQLQKGDIMVVESTDIGWTPFYNMVEGMVTEIGSALSHGIVVAREYALPAVVNVTNAMQLIHDGDRITIDGNKGLVVIDRRK